MHIRSCLTNLPDYGCYSSRYKQSSKLNTLSLAGQTFLSSIHKSETGREGRGKSGKELNDERSGQNDTLFV